MSGKHTHTAVMSGTSTVSMTTNGAKALAAVRVSPVHCTGVSVTPKNNYLKPVQTAATGFSAGVVSGMTTKFAATSGAASANDMFAAMQFEMNEAAMTGQAAPATTVDLIVHGHHMQHHTLATAADLTKVSFAPMPAGLDGNDGKGFVLIGAVDKTTNTKYHLFQYNPTKGMIEPCGKSDGTDNSVTVDAQDAATKHVKLVALHGKLAVLMQGESGTVRAVKYHLLERSGLDQPWTMHGAMKVAGGKLGFMQLDMGRLVAAATSKTALYIGQTGTSGQGCKLAFVDLTTVPDDKVNIDATLVPFDGTAPTGVTEVTNYSVVRRGATGDDAKEYIWILGKNNDAAPAVALFEVAAGAATIAAPKTAKLGALNANCTSIVQDEKNNLYTFDTTTRILYMSKDFGATWVASDALTAPTGTIAYQSLVTSHMDNRVYLMYYEDADKSYVVPLNTTLDSTNALKTLNDAKATVLQKTNALAHTGDHAGQGSLTNHGSATPVGMINGKGFMIMHADAMASVQINLPSRAGATTSTTTTKKTGSGLSTAATVGIVAGATVAAIGLSVVVWYGVKEAKANKPGSKSKKADDK